MIQLSNLLENSVETIELTATLETALCVGAGGSSGTLADKPIVRTADGKLLIPASQLKGRLRHECEKLARGLGWPVCLSPTPNKMCPQRANFSNENEFNRPDYVVPEDDRHHCIICQIFGNPTLPSRIIVDDLICEVDAENLPQVLRPGVTINRHRKTAEDQKLYFLETSPAYPLQFKGNIHLKPNIPIYAKPLLLSGLKHIHALGGSKSTGLGWLKWDIQPSNLIEKNDIQKLLPIQKV
jgi:CRISPR/Cas system CSM-associated protein Csm3 (group 7 of RAMP superfamily)